MGHVSAALRRLWGIRPGALTPPVTLVQRRRRMGEPRSGPHGRGWTARHRDTR